MSLHHKGVAYVYFQTWTVSQCAVLLEICNFVFKSDICWLFWLGSTYPPSSGGLF